MAGSMMERSLGTGETEGPLEIDEPKEGQEYDEVFDVTRLSKIETPEIVDGLSPIEKFSYVYEPLLKLRQSEITERETDDHDRIIFTFPKFALDTVYEGNKERIVYLGMKLICYPQGSPKAVIRRLVTEELEPAGNLPVPAGESRQSGGEESLEKYADGALGVDRQFIENRKLHRKYGKQIDNALNHLVLAIEDYKYLLNPPGEQGQSSEPKRRSEIRENDEISKAVGRLLGNDS